MAESSVNKLEKFSPADVNSCASEWQEYKRLFLVHLDAIGLHEAPGRRQVGQLLKHMGSDHIRTYDSFTWAPPVPAVDADPDNHIVAQDAIEGEDQYNLQTVFAKFDAHFGVHRYRSIKRQEFLSCRRKTESKQSIMSFISELKQKARHCDYGEKEESFIVDMVINKVHDVKCTERLMELPDDQLTLQNVIRVCRQVELTQSHLVALKSENTGEQPVHRVQRENHGNRGRMRSYSRGRGRSYSRGGSRQQHELRTCHKCCRKHDGHCKADYEFCGKCGEKGHFKKSPLCKANKSDTRYTRGYGGRPYQQRGKDRQYQTYRQNVHYSNTDGEDRNQVDENKLNEMFDMFDAFTINVDDDENNMHNLCVDKNNVHDLCVEQNNVNDVCVNVAAPADDDFYAVVKVNGKPLCLELDTGAKCNVISKNTLVNLGKKYEVKPSRVVVNGVHGYKKRVEGSTVLPCMYKGNVNHLVFQILDGPDDINLLGKTDCVKLGLVARVNKVSVEQSCKQLMSEYSDVVKEGIGCIPGEYEIKMDTSVTPVIHAPRSVPVALRQKVKEELDRMEEAGIIQKVTEPTPWVSSMVVVSKKEKDQVRICIDPTDLNKAILREHHPMNHIDDIATRLHGSKWFSTLDANMGYFQMRLTDQSSWLTTFNSPFGRYKYLRMPMGVKSSAEVFQRAIASAFQDIEGVEVVVDDILVHGATPEVHNRRLRHVLERCRKMNLRLNKKKCCVGRSEVDYVGHKLTGDGLKTTTERLNAITKMQSPQDTKELEAVLGMVAYVAKFVPNLSALTAPLRELKQNTDWQWGDREQDAFDKIKAELASDRVLTYFDVRKPVLLSVDASTKGLGAAVVQEGGVVAYASRALTAAEQNYAQIEKEMLAVVYGCTKFHKLIYGMKDVTIESDHKPLESLLKKPMSAAPLRIQRMRLKLQPYSFTLVHQKGKAIGLADCLSRLPADVTQSDIKMDDELMVCKVDTLAYRWHDRIEQATIEDEDLQTLRRTIFNGWPARKQQVPLCIAPYWDIRDQLSTYNGIVYCGERIVIPRSLRKELLNILHSAHTGIVRTKQRARVMIYWPGLNQQIEEITSKCEACLQQRSKQQKEPMEIHPVPALPWNKVGADLFEHEGNHYFLMVDYYSNYIEVVPLKQDTKSETIIRHIRTNIARYGIMETLMTDNGPQFDSSVFKDFTERYGINHITSSPTYPQSNGLAEEAVRQIKELMAKCKASGDDFYLALLDIRNTPRDEDMGSPMQRLHGRRAQTRLPISDNLLKPATISPTVAHDKMMEYRRRQKLYHDKGARQLKPINPEDAIRVWTPTGWKPAEYVRRHESPNSYVVAAGEQGRHYRRNRKHLLVTGEKPHEIRTPPPIPPLWISRSPEPPTPRTPTQPTPQLPRAKPTTTAPSAPPTETLGKPPEPATEKSHKSSVPEPTTATARPKRHVREPGWMQDYIRR